jgi:hypothetical protein
MLSVNIITRFFLIYPKSGEMSAYRRNELLQMRIPDIDADERPQEAADRIKRIISTGN